MAVAASDTPAESSVQLVPNEILLMIADQLIPESGIVISTSGERDSFETLKNLMLANSVLQRHVKQRMFSRPLNIWIDNECIKHTKYLRFRWCRKYPEALSATCGDDSYSFMPALKSINLRRWDKFNIHLDPGRQMTAKQFNHDGFHLDAFSAAEKLDEQRRTFRAQAGSISRWMKETGIADTINSLQTTLIIHEIEGRLPCVNPHMSWWTQLSIAQIIGDWRWIGGNIEDRVIHPCFSFLTWECYYQQLLQESGALQTPNEIANICATSLRAYWGSQYKGEGSRGRRKLGCVSKVLWTRQNLVEGSRTPMIIRINPTAIKFWDDRPVCSSLSIITQSEEIPKECTGMGIIELPPTTKQG